MKNILKWCKYNPIYKTFIQRKKKKVPSAHGHSASNVVREFHEFRSQIDCTTLPSRILQHPFHPTFNLFLSHLLRPFQLPRGEEFGHAQFLHQPPVGAVGGGHEAGAAEGELVGEGEGGAGGEGEVVGLEDVGGDFGWGDNEEAAGGAEAEEEEGAVGGGELVEGGVEGCGEEVEVP